MGSRHNPVSRQFSVTAAPTQPPRWARAQRKQVSFVFGPVPRLLCLTCAYEMHSAWQIIRREYAESRANFHGVWANES
jgi:hypothetical protein